ncbi:MULTISPECIES: hypothetical protein [unclassified Burkholderia]|uniref:hypothetical protein n=1 Tax=unclassified Burkholderia TaxID=2613784 RepID=UPI000F5751CB|nr:MULTISPECIES: hypothetical protein [unclassified Burkholderia]
MRFTYSDSAKRRVAQQGASSIVAFIEEVSSGLRNKIVATLPRVPGFRPNGPHVLKKKCELLAAAISHTLDEKSPRASSVDWNALGFLWAAWGREKFTHFPDGPYDFEYATEQEAHEFLRKLIESEKAGCAREDIERLMLFSGLPSVESISAFVDALPARATLERDRALAKLPDDVATLRHQILDVKQDLENVLLDVDAARAGAVAAANTVQRALDISGNTERRISVVEAQLSTGRSDEIASLTEQVDTLRGQLDALLKDSKDVWQVSVEDLRSEYSTLCSDLSGLASEVADSRRDLVAVCDRYEELASTLMAPVDAGPMPHDASGSCDVNVSPLQSPAGVLKWTRGSSGPQSARIDDVGEMFELVLENLVASAIRRTDSDAVARTVVSATLAGQLLQCCGSLADVLGGAACASVGAGNVFSWQVPLGLNNGCDVDLLLQMAEQQVPTPQALLLRGVNRSAFEVYGTGIRDVVLHRQLTRVAAIGQPSLIATWVEGPATLPGSAALVELGPVIDTDLLAWSSSSDVNKMRFGEIAIDVGHLEEVQTRSREHVSEVLQLVDALEFPPNRLWRLAFSRFISILFGLPGASFESNLSIALATWILPWAKARGLQRAKCEAAIVSYASEQLSMPFVRSALDGLLGERAT